MPGFRQEFPCLPGKRMAFLQGFVGLPGREFQWKMVVFRDPELEERLAAPSTGAKKPFVRTFHFPDSQFNISIGIIFLIPME